MAMIVVRLKKGKDTAIRKGFPWIYVGDLVDSSQWRIASPGVLVRVETQKGEYVGTAYLNPQSQITCRILTLSNEPIDETFFYKRFQVALARREHIINVPYYRLVHSEADGLPGLTIDRFGEILVVQVATAGMEALQSLWMPALEALLQPQAVVLRNDIPVRRLEGLLQSVSVVKGTVPEWVEVREYDTLFLADVIKGQKTGWFYDQRDNRKMIANLADGKTLLDVYSHSGGFGIPAARAGADVTLVDSSRPALELAAKAAALNGVAMEAICADAFEAMQRLVSSKQSFDMVCVDPPPFVKSKKDFAAGMKGYEKMARLAAPLVKPGGLLFAASCSHHATRGAFNNAILAGINKSCRDAAILKQTGAAPDHPCHPMLPQSEYLKGLLLKLS